jgi:molybdopterin/thiamine biosynthesis adenylyltransferase
MDAGGALEKMPRCKRRLGATGRQRGKTLVIVGLGNIGSPLVPHAARLPAIEAITLVDRDVYEEKNLVSQDIRPSDVGVAKVRVQARRLKTINPSLHVEAIHRAVEEVPVGHLRGNVIATCLDGRASRQYVGEVAWRLGVPLVDAGVEPGSLLARVSVYVPGANSACVECQWTDRDYEQLEQRYPCRGKVAEPATDAPSSLGALAASVQAIECQKLLAGNSGRGAANYEVLIDAMNHKLFLTRLVRNPKCRFDHRRWSIQRVACRPEDITIRQALELPRGAKSPVLRVPGKVFVKRFTCPGCRKVKSGLHLRHPLRLKERICSRCGKKMVASGFDMTDELDLSQLPRATINVRLRALGFRARDVFTIFDSTKGQESYYELSGSI